MRALERAHQAYVSYNTDLTATTPPTPTASSSSATATTAEPEDNTDDYSLRTRKLGSSPGPSELVHSESEPWQPTTSSAIGLPNPSPPLPPPFLTCATASHRTTPLSPNRAVRPSDSTESPPNAHPHYHYISLRSVSGDSRRPSIRGNRWVIPTRGLLKCFF